MDNIEETEVDVNHPEAGTISAIDKKSVHRICSGQVVLTLATAVKELLENSIDAGATIIDIKLKDYGSEQIEVSDNGNGVHQNNFEGLTLKHHTSKLQDFSDLINVETFGFRGEALSSLCALSDMCVCTRHKDAAVGTRLEFDHNGKLLKQSKQARQIGTTISLQNLFNTLPVRHKEFQRNLKKEFVKMVQVLNSYCIISTDVRITCSNQTGKGSKSTVVSSKGNSNMLENISNVFGPKQPLSLLEFKKYEPNDDQCSEFGIKKDNTSLFSIEGYVSKCEHGQGRSSTDRQFFFINGRPFDSMKLSKVINEVYHQYNRHQYPFVAFKISVQKDNVDVNVTPDKRQVFLEGEKVIMATVKASLISMYEPTTSILQYQMPAKLPSGSGNVAQPSSASNFTRLSKHASLEKPTGLTSLMKLKRSFSSAFSKGDSNVGTSPTKSGSQVKQRRLDSFVSSYHSPVKTFNDNSCRDKDGIESENDVIVLDDDKQEVSEKNDIVKETMVIVEHRCSNDTKSNFEESNMSKQDRNFDNFGREIPVDETGDNNNTGNAGEINKGENGTFIKCSKSLGNLSVTDKLNEDSELRKLEASKIPTNNSLEHDPREKHVHNSPKCVQQNNDLSAFTITECVQNDTICVQKYTSAQNEVDKDAVMFADSKCTLTEVESDKVDLSVNENKILVESDVSDVCIVKHEVKGRSVRKESEIEQSVSIIPHKSEETMGDMHDIIAITQEEHLDTEEEVEKKESSISFSMDKLKNRLKSREKNAESCRFSRAFRATINPTENQAAEHELQREIKKDMFSTMEILGQFNKGFIITQLEKDLFIVDQHATDEKFNFEMLQRDTVIQSQKLIAPLNLELTSSSETILMDNIDIFTKNGFEFLIDEEGLPTQRVKLMSTPVSKNWNFGKEDIEEMIFMLTDSPGVTCRPSRVRAMFASRACRKSIMIGTRLNKAEMKKLVSHMGEIEQPWNCPHGRPTMRHLINLDMVPK